MHHELQYCVQVVFVPNSVQNQDQFEDIWLLKANRGNRKNVQPTKAFVQRIVQCKLN